MPDPTPSQDVPPELKMNLESKEAAAQKAEDQVKNEVKKSEAFLSAIGYISFLCILPLLLLRDSKFAQFHGKQALVLAIFIYFFDFIQIFPAQFAAVYTALKIIIVIYAIIMAAKGSYFKIPFIYTLSEKFSIDIKQEEKATVPTN
ncbi:MAG TPA: hypothetical protein VJ521_16740 [Acidobacteriota bacterium]|nr:hypothetical protein [Acidobacteriota bacterium]